MAISFSDAPGNLFNRWGKLGATIKTLSTYQATQLVNFTDTTLGVVAQYNYESDIQAIMGGSYIGLLNGAGAGLGSIMQSIAAATANRMVFRDNPRLNQTLQSSNLSASLQEIIRQMKLAGASIRACPVTAMPSTNPDPGGGSFTGIGNGVITASVRRPLDGRVLENCYSESLLFTCNADSYSRGAVAGNESFIVNGVGASTDPFAFNWPLGSNAVTSLSAIDCNSSNSNGNVLTNSSFEKFTSNIPDNFDLVVGNAGSNVFEETTIVYNPFAGGKSLRILGDGLGTLTELRQKFDDTDGTPAILTPLTQYSFCCFMRRDGVAPAAGILEISLIDEDGNIILDENGTANLFTIDLTMLTTAFQSFTSAFRTPAILPDVINLRIRLSTAVTNGRSVYLDAMSMGRMTQVYTAGPFVAVHSGSVPFLVGDYGTCTIVNGRGAGGTLHTFQTLLARLFPNEVMGSGLLFPSSSSPTISDTLIG